MRKKSKRQNEGKNTQILEKEIRFRLPSLSLGFGNDRRGMSRGRRKPDDLDYFYKRKQKPCVYRLPLFPLQEITRLEVGV